MKILDQITGGDPKLRMAIKIMKNGLSIQVTPLWDVAQILYDDEGFSETHCPFGDNRSSKKILWDPGTMCWKIIVRTVENTWVASQLAPIAVKRSPLLMKTI